MTSDNERLVLIIWLGIVAPALLLNLFALLVIGCDKTRLGLCLMTSSLACRIGHVIVVIPLWAVVTLEERFWSKELCYVFAMTWFLFALCDVMTSLLFLCYYTRNIASIYDSNASRLRRTEIAITIVMWIAAVFMSSVPVYVGRELLDYEITRDECYIGSFYAELPVQVAVIAVTSLTLIVCLLLLVRLNSDVTGLCQTHHIFCKIVELRKRKRSVTSQLHVANGRTTRRVERRFTPQIFKQDKSKPTDASTEAANTADVTESESTRTTTTPYETQVQITARLETSKCRLMNYWNAKRHCSYVINLRHVRSILNVIVVCSLLLNALPQLVRLNFSSFRRIVL